jgi:hypothetical protein
MNKLIIYIAFLFVFTSCKKAFETETKIVETNAFYNIKTLSSFDIYLTEDTFYHVKITDATEMLENISIWIDNDTLKIKNNNKKLWLNPKHEKPKIYITAKKLSNISLAEGCYLESQNPLTSEWLGLILYGKVNEAKLTLKNKNFYYWNMFPCGGKLTLSGETDRLHIWNFGLMNVDAKNLTCRYGLIENNGKNNCAISVTDSLLYQIKGKGDIVLYSNTTVIINQGAESIGKLVKK